jgi:hypothetical protein
MQEQFTQLRPSMSGFISLQNSKTVSCFSILVFSYFNILKPLLIVVFLFLPSLILFSASTTFFPSLKSLKLWRCPNLKGWWRRDIVDAATTTSISSDQYQQHISFRSFPCLSDMRIRNCNNLTCMPLFPYLEENLYLKNTSLKPLQETMAMTMNMSATSSLPSSSSSSPPLSKLKSLSLYGIQDVESLPEELLQNLASLEYLWIWSCPRLKSLPRFMQHLTSLKKLNIGQCEELDLFSEESDDGTQCVTTLQSSIFPMCPNLSSLYLNGPATSHHFKGSNLKDAQI